MITAQHKCTIYHLVTPTRKNSGFPLVKEIGVESMTQSGYVYVRAQHSGRVCHAWVLSRNGFLGADDGRGKYALGIGVWGLPPRKVLVCLYMSASICQCLLAGKSLLYAIILYSNNLLKKQGFLGLYLSCHM